MPTPLESAMPPAGRRPSSGRAPEHAALLPVVDPHVRLDDASPDAGSGTDTLAPLRGFLDRRGGCHLLRAVHVQADTTWKEALADVERVQAIARTPGSGGLPNGIVACCELAVDDLEARLDALARHPNVRGVRLPAGAELPADLAPLERRDLVLELDAGAVPIGDVVWLATAHPGCRLVLAGTEAWAKESEADAPPGGTRPSNGAGGATPTDVDRRHAAALRRLAPLERVALKLARRDATGPHDGPDSLDAPGARDAHDALDSPDSLEARRRLGSLVERAIDAVGPGRVMLASGSPRSVPDRPWHEAWRAFGIATRGIPASRRNALFRANAVRVYRL